MSEEQRQAVHCAGELFARIAEALNLSGFRVQGSGFRVQRQNRRGVETATDREFRFPWRKGNSNSHGEKGIQTPMAKI